MKKVLLILTLLYSTLLLANNFVNYSEKDLDILNGLSIIAKEGKKEFENELSLKKEQLWNNHIIKNLKIVDGNTVKLGNITIKVLGLIMPETKQNKLNETAFPELWNAEKVKKLEEDVLKNYAPAGVDLKYDIAGNPKTDKFGRALGDVYLHPKLPDGSIDTSKVVSLKGLMVNNNIGIDLDNPEKNIDKLPISEYAKRDMLVKAKLTKVEQYRSNFQEDNIAIHEQKLVKSLNLGIKKLIDKGADEKIIKIAENNKLKYIKEVRKKSINKTELQVIEYIANRDYLNALKIQAQRNINLNKRMKQNNQLALKEVESKYLDGNKIKDVVDGRRLTTKDKVEIEETLNFFRDKKNKVYADYKIPFHLNANSKEFVMSDEGKIVLDYIGKHVAKNPHKDETTIGDYIKKLWEKLFGLTRSKAPAL